MIKSKKKFNSGLRTIGVITKADLAPNDDDLCQQLLMEKKEVLQLKLGFIAVRNRTADERMNLKNARKREKQFFRGHIAASKVGLHCLGVDALINRLADLYADRVKQTFPQMRVEVQNKLDEVIQQLSKFPVALDTSCARLGKYHELVDFYVENVLKSRLATGDDFSSLINILHGKFSKFQQILKKQTKGMYTSAYTAKVSNAMSACSGEQLPNFLPHPLLKRFKDEKIEELWTTTKSLINDCHATTLEFVLSDEHDRIQLDDFLLQKLIPAFSNIIGLYLNEQRKSVLDQLQGLINLEKNDPYTMNNAYMELILKFKLERGDAEYTNDDQAVNDMVESLRSYWEVLQKRYLDYATLSIRDRFVFSVCSGARERFRQVPSEQCDFVDGHLSEDAHTRAQRMKLQQRHDQLNKCLDILGGRTATDANSTEFLPMKNELDAIMEKLQEDNKSDESNDD